MSAEPVESRIKGWLQEQGYPLEMAVAKAFQGEGFRVIQSEYYHDAESDSFRETDVVASVQHEWAGYLTRFTFVIECKLSSSKPWLMFTSAASQIHPRAAIAQRVGSNLGRQLLQQLAPLEHVQQLDLFRVSPRPAYGMTQAFTTGRDEPYAAALSVAKAAYATAKRADVATEHQRDACEIVFPVVVVDGRLFECYLSEESEPEVSETSHGMLLWRNPIAGMPHTIISVVSASALADYVGRMRNDFEAMKSTLEITLGGMASSQPEQIRRMLREHESEGGSHEAA